YQAVLLYRGRLDAGAQRVIGKLAGAISNTDMIDLNARVTLEHVSERAAAEDFLARHLSVRPTGHDATFAERLAARTREHLFLVAISLLAALAVAIPLGILAAKRPIIGQFLLAGVGVMQTVPSLALLVLMIPLLGIGALPALAAMFLYSLLPIVRNTA